ncbi:arsenic efflux protein [Candidatus Saccharibacteria bacterium]|nr:arsenic efflux protein [Candidatus Saccharibacteria bacterium]
MLDCLIDALLDVAKIAPYLLATFLILELIEHKLKYKKLFAKKHRLMPVAGGLLGALPQCGFSAMAANLFSGHIVTIGTVIAIFLATSDEMLPIMIGESVEATEIFKIIGFKVAIGIAVGLIVDLIYRKKSSTNETPDIGHICEDEHCHCEKNGIFLSSLIHTLKTLLLIFAANLLIGLIIFWIGEEKVAGILLNKGLLSYLIAALVGLIPSCAGSVIITELYLAGLISFGSLMAGLLTGCGVGWLLLFKNNKNQRENGMILAIIFVVSLVAGAIFDLF